MFVHVGPSLCDTLQIPLLLGANRYELFKFQSVGR